jgi:hypothetical protein
MNEGVGAALLWFDEAKAFDGIEPLDCSGIHDE